MSNPVLQLAEQIHAARDDGFGVETPAEKLADALLEATRDNTAMANRYQVLYRNYNVAVHQRDDAWEALQRIDARPGQLREVVTIRCQSGCHALLELTPMHKPDVPVLVRLAGWTVNADGQYRCRGCQ